MATNNAINLKAQGVAYYNGTGLFSAPSLSQFGTVVGAASNSIATIATGTAGQALVSAGAASNPAYGTLPVAGGGTGLAAITAHYLVVGNGTSALTLLAPSATSGVALISQGSSADPAYGTVVVAGGGTGVTSLTAYALVAGGTTSTGNVQQVSGLGSSGQVLTSSGAAALPVWATPTANYFPTSIVVVDTQALAVNHIYVSADVTDPVDYTLPASSAVGSIIRITGIATGNGWTVVQDTDQYIQLGSSSTTVGAGGSLASTNANDTIEMLCVEADLGWVVLSSVGNITIV